VTARAALSHKKVGVTPTVSNHFSGGCPRREQKCHFNRHLAEEVRQIRIWKRDIPEKNDWGKQNWVPTNQRRSNSIYRRHRWGNRIPRQAQYRIPITRWDYILTIKRADAQARDRLHIQLKERSPPKGGQVRKGSINIDRSEQGTQQSKKHARPDMFHHGKQVGGKKGAGRKRFRSWFETHVRAAPALSHPGIVVSLAGVLMNKEQIEKGMEPALVPLRGGRVTNHEEKGRNYDWPNNYRRTNFGEKKKISKTRRKHKAIDEKRSSSSGSRGEPNPAYSASTGPC